jgi:hypothetical protein
MFTSVELDKDESDKNVNIYLYRGMIGSLYYLTTNRLDIMFVACLCACY